jgi:hypothetical protein
LYQDIEGRHSERQTGLEIYQDPMYDLLEVGDECQHRQHSLNEDAVVPLAALTEFEAGGIAFRGMKGRITQDNHLFFKLPNEPLKGVIRNIGGGTLLRHDQSPLIEQQTAFPPDDPAVIREAFPADLVRTPAFAHGVDQLDAIRVDDAEYGRSSQEELRPGLMSPEEAKEPRPLG